MPPPPIPTAAQALASIVGSVVIDIHERQGTPPSVSDVTRGVHKAMDNGLTIIDYTFAQKVCDAVHPTPEAWANGHRDGFCKACANVYLAVCDAMRLVRREGMPT